MGSYPGGGTWNDGGSAVGSSSSIPPLQRMEEASRLFNARKRDERTAAKADKLMAAEEEGQNHQRNTIITLAVIGGLALVAWYFLK